jgi:hypothetical protein
MGLKNFGACVNYLSVEQLKHSFVAILSLDRAPVLNPPRNTEANSKMACVLNRRPSPFSHLQPYFAESWCRYELSSHTRSSTIWATEGVCTASTIVSWFSFRLLACIDLAFQRVPLKSIPSSIDVIYRILPPPFMMLLTVCLFRSSHP